MISPEELFENIMYEEGQFLLGLDFIYNSLQLDMNKISKIFKKTIKEYSKRVPFLETMFAYTNPIQLPEDTLSVSSIRYGLLPDAPSTVFPTFGEEYQEIQFNWDNFKKLVTVKNWPPITNLRVLFTREYRLTRDAKIVETFNVFEDEILEETLKATPRTGTLKITKNNNTMKVTSSGTKKTIIGGDEELLDVSILTGTLGTGTLENSTRKLTLNTLDTTEGTITIEYYPKYECAIELDLGNYVFTKLFAAKVLMALAALRAQATQQELFSIDLTADDLMARVRVLQREANTLLRNTKDYSGLAPI